MGTIAVHPLSEGVYLQRGNLIVKEPYALYVFCGVCGGLKTFHLLEAESPSQNTMLSSAIWRSCECYKAHLPIKPIDTDQFIGRFLNDMSSAIKNTIRMAKTVEEAGEKAEQLIWRLASRQEMK
jgi:hypothetical protein